MRNVIRLIGIFVLLAATFSTGLPTHAAPDGPLVPSAPSAPSATTATQPRYQGYASFITGGGQWLSVPHNAAYVPGTSGTVEAWIYPIAPVGFDGCRAAVGKDYSSGFWLGLCAGKVRGHVGGTAAYIDGGTTLPANTWTHIALTWDGRAMYLYVNGDIDSYGECSPDTIAYCYNPPSGTRDLRIGDDHPGDVFNGYISEVRIWSYDRGEYGLRSTMNIALDEKLPGLLAVWHLTDSYADGIGGYTAAPTGPFVGIIPGNPPIRPATTPVDGTFNRLPNKTMGAASAFVPTLNAGLLIGGVRDAVASAAITRIDGGSGDSTSLGALPAARTYAGAAYADSNDTIYVFGGSSQVDAKNQFNTIYAINPSNGTARTVAVALPQAISGMNAVYHAGLNKIALLGGFIWNGATFDYSNAVYIFDVATETIAPAGFSLPYIVNGSSSVYSAATNRIYVMGGCANTVFYDTIVEVNLTGGASGSATTLPQRLPSQNCAGGAVVDPVTHLVYVINGSNDWRVTVFDPLTQQVWQTPIAMPFAGGDSFSLGTPQNRTYSSVIYSPRNRQALVLGGGGYGDEGNAFNSIWRVPLGNGPLTTLNTWGVVGNTAPVLSMDGKGPYFAFGRTNNGYKVDGRVLTNDFVAFDTQGQGNIINLKWLKGDTPWFFFSADNRAIYRNEPIGTTRLYNPFPCPNPPYGDVSQKINDLESTTDSINPVAGLNGIIGYAGGCQSLRSPDGAYYQPHWGTCQQTWDVAQRATQDDPSVSSWKINAVWGIVNDGSCVDPGPRFATQSALTGTAASPPLTATAATSPAITTNAVAGPDAPAAPTAYQRRYLQALRQHPSTFPDTEYDMGLLCANAIEPERLAFGLNGDMWLAGPGGVCRYPSSAIPAFLPATIASQISGSNIFNVPIGSLVQAGPSVDSDGRVWFGSKPATTSGTESGGLSVFEVLNGTSAGAIRATDYNWLNSPLGSSVPRPNAWDSHLDVVSANDEKVWMARAEDITTLAQRWGNLRGVEGQNILHVWTARGRLFAASAANLFVLQPDGLTWSTHAIAGVNAVLQDRAGRIWVAHNGGVGLYSAAGLTPVPGLSLAEPVSALAEDMAGRMWLGTNTGLALYDRDRLVTRLALPNGNAAANVLLADKAGNVWAGNTAGLARLNVGDSSWTLFGTAQGLPDNDVKDLAQAGDGTIYVSTANGLAAFVEASGSFTAQTRPDSVASLPLAVDELGRLWAGNGMLNATTNGGSWKMRYWTNSGLQQATLNDVAADGADRVYFAQAGGVVVRATFLPPLAEEVPVITDYNPKRAARNTEIVIDGSGFGNDATGVQVQIGGRDVAVTEVTANRIRVRVDSEVQSGLLSVRRGKRRTTSGTGFCAIPTIFTATPTGGNVGINVDVRGANFDPNVTIALGAAPRQPLTRTVSSLRTQIDAADRNGNLVITNACGDTATQADFRKFDLSIANVVLNQNYPSFQLHARNATLLSVYLRVSAAPRASDVISISRMEVRLSLNGNQSVQDVNIPFAAAPPYLLPNAPVNLNSTAGALNVPNLKFDVNGAGTVRVALSANYKPVAQQTTNVTLNAGARNTYILLVPIMPMGFTNAQLTAFKASVDANIADFSSRIYPGGLNPLWADEALTGNQIAAGGLVSIASGSEFNMAAVLMETLRKRFNSARGTNIVGTSIGVINPAVVNPSNAAGMGSLGEFSGWKDQQECIDDEDDFIDEVGDFLGFGDDDCGPEQPRYMAWVTGDGNVSRYLAHELGHNMGMVQNGAPHYANYGGSGGDNHDKASELVAGTPPAVVQCGTKGATYNFGATFNQQPNVNLPVVNPISGNELTVASAGVNASGLSTVSKALLSYACNRDGINTFLEPADVNYLLAERYRSLLPIYALAASSQRQAALQTAPQQPTEARQLHQAPKLGVAGVLTPGNPSTVTFINVEPLPNTVRPSADYLSAYTLAQVSAAGVVLASQGVLMQAGHTSNHDVNAAPAYAPASISPQHEGHEAHDDANMPHWFATTIIRQPGVARLTLFKDGVALASFAPGGNPPTAAINPPVVGADGVDFAWTASDPDGDRVSVNVQFSRDGGATWRSVASGVGNGTAHVTMGQLGGSANARARVIASDGFQVVTATSGAFATPMQPPSAVIQMPTANLSVLEGRPLTLRGYGLDAQDGMISQTARLRWRSNRDGGLGTGADLYAILSAGQHVIALEVTNANGQKGTANVTVNVIADYDGDGISDADEAKTGLNALTASDAYSDADGDGVPLVLERKAGTNPSQADTDGDGRKDGDELAAGTNPAANDAPLGPDQVTLWPRSVVVTVDFAKPNNLINEVMQVTSRDNSNYTLSADVGWLQLDKTTGTTPGSATLVIDALSLNEGLNVGTLRAAGANNTSASTVMITVINKQRYCDVNGDGVLNAADKAAIEAQLGKTVGQPGYSFTLDLSRNGVIDAADVAATATCNATGGGARKLNLPLILR